MKTTLYKLKEGYVLCNNEDIKDNDIVLVNKKWHDNVLRIFTTVFGGTKEGCKKVLTQSPDFSLLSEEDAKEIGWFDFGKIFKEESETKFGSQLFIDYATIGFKKALELTADRRFTEEDMIKAYHWGTNAGASFESSCGDHDNSEVIHEAHEFADAEEKEFIQSLSQPKSWEVEYKEENGVYKITKIL
jgi:hypothetical protein